MTHVKLASLRLYKVSSGGLEREAGVTIGSSFALYTIRLLEKIPHKVGRVSQ